MTARFRQVSLVLSATAMSIVGITWRPDSDPTAYLDRALEAALIIGAIGGAVHGLGWRTDNRLIMFLADPRVAWTAMVLGGGYAFLR